MARNRNGRFLSTYRDRFGKLQTTLTFATAKEAEARKGAGQGSGVARYGVMACRGGACELK